MELVLLVGQLRLLQSHLWLSGRGLDARRGRRLGALLSGRVGRGISLSLRSEGCSAVLLRLACELELPLPCLVKSCTRVLLDARGFRVCHDPFNSLVESLPNKSFVDLPIVSLDYRTVGYSCSLYISYQDSTSMQTYPENFLHYGKALHECAEVLKSLVRVAWELKISCLGIPDGALQLLLVMLEGSIG